MSYACNIIALEPNPFRGWGADASCDANRIHVDADGRLVVFHTTTPERAAEIIASGPKAHAVRVGFGGEHRTPAFWVNCVPWVPYSVEQFHPTFGADQDLSAFVRDMGGAVELKRIALTEQQALEHCPHACIPCEPGRNGGNHGDGFDSAVECQLEAMPKAMLRQIISEAFEAELDMALVYEQIAAEDAMKTDALRLLLEAAQ